MNRIQILHPHIANQIAAGEVVERPASVVKELMENALDAGATTIKIEIENGGLRSIRVNDNGAGIPAEECILAFERHATSKINTQEDLTHIDTLGFRGEALASIAAVAQVEMKSRVADATTGMRVRVEGGERKLVQPASCVQGTSFTVENLFYNVPARRKFLKSPRSEAGHIGDYISRMILARPDVSFRYTSEGRTVYHSQGDRSLKNAVYCVYGGEPLPYLREVNYDDGYLRMTGFIATFEAARPNRNQQSFFLNGRYIRSAQISNALMRAYDTQLMGKRYPFAVLHITISSREVDVNVHPTKLEVRFAQEGRVLDSIMNACADALADRHIPAARLSKDVSEQEPLPAAAKADVAYSAAETELEKERPPALDFEAMEAAEPFTMRVKESEFSIPQYRVQATLETVGATAPVTLDLPEDEEDKALSAPATERFLQEEQQSLSAEPMAVLGQAFSSYWIVQQGESLYLIDQHAAHERILYERLMHEAEAQASQALFIPEIIRLSQLEGDILADSGEELAALGFDISPFDATSVRVDAIPAVLTGGSIADALRDALELIRRQGKASTKALRREAIVQAACKHAVKAGDSLTERELGWLLDHFLQSETPFTCPHGRPIVVRLSKTEIEKLFKRIV